MSQPPILGYQSEATCRGGPNSGIVYLSGQRKVAVGKRYYEIHRTAEDERK